MMTKKTNPTDFRHVFHIKNVVVYYLWHYKQKIFWLCSSRSTPPLHELLSNKISRKYRWYAACAAWLKKDTKIGYQKPYPIDK